MSLLALYHRLFGHINRVRYQIWAAAILSLPLLAFTVVLPVYAAPPPGKPWGTVLNSRNGAANAKASMGVSVDSFVVDLLIFYIPIPVILKLNLNSRKKAGVLLMFMTGFM